jgi:steroid delta-isomerase-like uncharacterized protein
MITAQDNATLARTIVDAYNERAFDKAAALFAPDATCLNVALNAKFQGPAGYREFLQNWATAFPDSKVELTSIAAGDEYTAVEFTGRGTNTGSFKTPESTIPATGKKVELRCCQVFRFKNGKVTETRHYFDSATLLRQLGLTK